ncbi:MAG: hypothetical protein EOO15_01305 [Chitinophagaceae bacterium]|nr:MAG: hypothetical protein EOO15_01305 [Chitinophagaceae bacterium]
MLKKLTSGAALSAIGLTCTLSLNFVMARSGGADQLGNYAECLAWHIVLATIGTFGSDRLAIRELSRQVHAKHIAQILLHLYRRSMLASLPLILCGVIGWVIHVFQANEKGSVLLAISCGTAPLTSTLILLIGAMHGLNRSSAAQFHEQVIRPLITLGAAALWTLWAPTSAASIFGIYLAATLIAVTSAYLTLAKHLSQKIPESVEKLSTEQLRQISSPANTLTLAVAANVLTSRADILLLGLMASPSTLGLYHLAARIAALSNTLQSILSSVIASKASSLLHDRNLNKLQSTIGKAVAAACTLSVPWFILLATFASNILLMFGPEYTSASSILYILLIGSMINIATGPAGMLLSCARQDKDLLAATLLGLLCMCAVIVALTPHWGAEGCAIGASIGVTACNLYAVIQVWRKVHIDSTVFAAFKSKFLT